MCAGNQTSSLSITPELASWPDSNFSTFFSPAPPVFQDPGNLPASSLAKAELASLAIGGLVELRDGDMEGTVLRLTHR